MASSSSRLFSIVSRLTPPPIVRGDSLPQLGRICQSAALLGDGSTPPPPDRPTLFSDLIKAQNEGSNSDSDVSRQTQSSTSIADICRAARERRAVFIGEQHQQPKVLSAQLQLLYHIARGGAADEPGQASGSTKSSSPPKPNVHVVLEQWSLDDQPLLHKINNTDDAGEIDSLLQQSGEQTSEGFPVAFYAEIIRLTRQLGGTVWGGFPPRNWARIVAKGGTNTESGTSSQPSSHTDPEQAFHEVQKLDQERYARTFAEIGSDDAVIPVLPAEQYQQVSNISWAHRTFLKSMFAPVERPDVPAGACAATSSAQQPSPPPAAYKGFAAAQALKDTFFAHAVSTLLQRDTNSIVVAICGLGHCEWSLGAPERVRYGAADEEQSTAPFIIITKPDDSVFWPALTDERAAKVSGKDWQRNQADAILLYEWVD